MIKCKIQLGEPITSSELNELEEHAKETESKVDKIDIAINLLIFKSTGLNGSEFYDEYNRIIQDSIVQHSLIYKRNLLIAKRRFSEYHYRWKDAFSSYQEITALNESIDQISQKHLVLDLEAQYKKREQDNEIRFLDQENRSKGKLISSKNKLLTVAIIAVILISFLSLILLRSRKIIASQNKRISLALQEKDTLLREIHHRVKIISKSFLHY